MVSFDCKDKLLGLDPDSSEFIYVGTKLNGQFILSKTVRVSKIIRIKVLSRKPKGVGDSLKIILKPCVNYAGFLFTTEFRLWGENAQKWNGRL